MLMPTCCRQHVFKTDVPMCGFAGQMFDVDEVVMEVVFEEYTRYMKEHYGNEANRFLRAHSTLDMRAPHSWYPLVSVHSINPSS